jgi:hypothetical protein
MTTFDKIRRSEVTMEQQESSADDSRARTVIGLVVLIKRQHGLQIRGPEVLRDSIELTEDTIGEKEGKVDIGV